MCQPVHEGFHFGKVCSELAFGPFCVITWLGQNAERWNAMWVYFEGTRKDVSPTETWSLLNAPGQTSIVLPDGKSISLRGRRAGTLASSEFLLALTARFPNRRWPFQGANT